MVKKSELKLLQFMKGPMIINIFQENSSIKFLNDIRIKLKTKKLLFGITGNCEYLPPLLISTRKHLDKDSENTFLLRNLFITHSQKGYLNSEIMKSWINLNLITYISSIREKYEKPNLQSTHGFYDFSF